MDISDEVLIARVNGSKDHYEALQIGWDAKADQIKRAYRQVRTPTYPTRTVIRRLPSPYSVY